MAAGCAPRERRVGNELERQQAPGHGPHQTLGEIPPECRKSTPLGPCLEHPEHTGRHQHLRHREQVEVPRWGGLEAKGKGAAQKEESEWEVEPSGEREWKECRELFWLGVGGHLQRVMLPRARGSR